MTIVTVPGGNGVVIAIPYTESSNAAEATALLQNLYYAPEQLTHIADASLGSGFDGAVPGDENALIDNVAGQVSVPGGYQYVVGDYVTPNSGAYPVNSFIAAGDLDGSVINSGPAALSFTAGTGAVTIVAGGNLTIGTRSSGGGNGVLMLDGAGSETLNLTSGSWSVITGTGSGSITLGSGADTVYAEGIDTVRGGTGVQTVVLDHGLDLYQGGGGTATVVDNGVDDTIAAGSGLETVFAQATGERLTGGASQVLFIDGADGGNTVVGGAGGIVAFGGAHGSTYQAPDNYFLFTSGGGNDSITAPLGTEGPVVFGSPNGRVHIDAAASGSFVVAGGGNETIDASDSTAGVVFFAGTGNADLIGGSGSNFYAASSGNSTLSGGVGNVYEFIDGHAGATDIITDFGPYDSLYLSGYGLGENDGIVSEVTTSGVLNLTLTDGTRIVFQNLSSAAGLDGKIHHI